MAIGKNSSHIVKMFEKNSVLINPKQMKYSQYILTNPLCFSGTLLMAYLYAFNKNAKNRIENKPKRPNISNQAECPPTV